MPWVATHQQARSAVTIKKIKGRGHENINSCDHAVADTGYDTVQFRLFSHSVLTFIFMPRIERVGVVGAAALVAGMAFFQPALAQTNPIVQHAGTKTLHNEVKPRRQLIRGIVFSGNHMISSMKLQAALPALPAPVDLATIKNISETITSYYRSHGYPFAHAYFPPQRSKDGILTLNIIEGQFGKVTVENKSALSTALARRVVETNLCGPNKNCVDAPITTERLQRASLILSDQPGVRSAATFQRGGKFGTSDLNVLVKPGDRFNFLAGVDNFGTPSTGNWRGSIGGSANELLGRGDELDIDLVGSGQQLWNGMATYSLLLLPTGLRGGISGGRTHYELGGAFKSLDVNGYADTISVFLSYPFVRTLNANLNATLTYQHKSLHDNIGGADYRSRHLLDNAVFSLDGNIADDFLGGGYNEFAVSVVDGFVHGLDADTLASDQDPQYGLFTKGNFLKLTFSFDRQQSLPGPFSLFASVNGQVANKNLVSAEQFYIGGPSGVRAYPVGEGAADDGVIGTGELRYTVPFTPLPGSVLTLAGFYDNGLIRRNENPPIGVINNTVDYGDAGLRAGLGKRNKYAINLIWAHRLGGEQSQIEPGRNDYVWLQVSFRY